MNTVIRVIRLLEVILLVGYVRSQDGFSEQDLLRLQQLSSNDGQFETITSYSTNVVHRDPSKNEHSVSAVSVQYHITDEPEKNGDLQPISHGRSDNRRKIFHIKNPFQRQLNQNSETEPEAFSSQDSNTGASNQYASVQYSLPPEDFLQQMRAESQYLQQYSTPAPSASYTVTPQPQYQYNGNSQGDYEGTQTSNQVDTKISSPQAYNSNPNNIQYISQQNSYLTDNIQSSPVSQSPVPPYLSTPVSNEQYVGTPTNSQSYVSSASPIFLSSPSIIPQYVSSPVTVYQTGSDYPNHITTVGGSINYDSDSNKKMQIDHYNNAVVGIRYPSNVPQQYQNEYQSTTITPPSSTSYPDAMRDAWQNAMNAGVNSMAKSLQESSLITQYQNNDIQHQPRHDANPDVNSETHRMGNNMASANSMYLNIVQPDYQMYQNMKSRTRDLEQETGQPSLYSHGDYGWKLAGKKSLVDSYGSSVYSPYSRQHTMALQSENPLSQGSYQAEQQKTQNNYAYNPQRVESSKSSSEQIEAQEFVKAAAKAQENMKQQQAARLAEHYYLNNYAPSYGSSNGGGSNNVQSQSNVVSTYYGNADNKYKTKYNSDNSNQLLYGSQPTDLITASPFYYTNSRDSDSDTKSKQPFDHAKALKNIVPIDVSNVVSNSENALKTLSSLENSRYNTQNYPKEQIEQSIKQIYRPLTDSYYKDKNSGYGFNIKSKPDDNTPNEQNIGFYNKQNQQENSYNQGTFSDTKRYPDNSPQQINYVSQPTNSFQDNLQPPNNIQQAIQRAPQQQTDLSAFLKLNDIPYRLTQGLNNDALKFHNNNFDHGSIPQPIPNRINQNVGSHQLDVTNSILNKLILNKQAGLQNYNRPNEVDAQTGGLLSTINGFRVANPFNVDLKLVAEMLKGKPAVDEAHMAALREQYNKPLPLKLDMSTLQHLLIKNDNYGNLAPLSDGLSAIGNSYIDPYNSGRFPYQGGVKYSRSQEEEESILPIAESTNTHPIGAVMEQGDLPNGRDVDGGVDLTAQDLDIISTNNFDETGPKALFNNHRVASGPRHPNSLIQGRHSNHRSKYPKHDMAEPYPLLKPPPRQQFRSRVPHSKGDRRGRRRRINKPKITKIIDTEPLFESESKMIQSDNDSDMPIVLRPPPNIAEDKADTIDKKSS